MIQSIVWIQNVQVMDIVWLAFVCVAKDGREPIAQSRTPMPCIVYPIVRDMETLIFNCNNVFVTNDGLDPIALKVCCGFETK